MKKDKATTKTEQEKQESRSALEAVYKILPKPKGSGVPKIRPDGTRVG